MMLLLIASTVTLMRIIHKLTISLRRQISLESTAVCGSNDDDVDHDHHGDDDHYDNGGRDHVDVYIDNDDVDVDVDVDDLPRQHCCVRL